jgi:hypothetical protein
MSPRRPILFTGSAFVPADNSIPILDGKRRP